MHPLAGRGMIGREREAGIVTRALRRAGRGPVGCLIDGDPGIGKTTMLRHAAVVAARIGCLVLAASPESAESVLPFVGLSDLFDPVVGQADGLPDVLQAALMAAMLRTSTETAPANLRAVSTGALELVRRLSAERPVAMVVDDLQWLDTSSAGVLRFVLRRLRRERVAVVAARRSGSGPPGDLLDGLDPPLRTVRVPLEPLRAADVDSLLRDHWTGGSTRDQRRAVIERAGGNPYLALELARSRSAPDGAAQVPQAARDWVHERLSGLSPAVQRAVLVVALARRPTAGEVATVLGAHGMTAVQAALDAGVLVEQGSRITVAHPLIGSVAREEASAAASRRIHARLAENATDEVERGWQLARSLQRSDAEAAAAIAAGAAASRARGAMSEAAQLYSEAVRVSPAGSGDGVGRWRLDAADCATAAGDSGQAMTLLEELAAPLAGGPERAEVLARLGVLQYRGSDLGAAIETLRAALADAAGGEPLTSLIERRLAIAEVMSGQIPEGVQRAVTAAARARAAGEHQAAFEAEAFLAMVGFLAGQPGALEALRAMPVPPAADGPSSLWSVTPAELRPETLRALAASMAGPHAAGEQELRALYRAATQEGDEWSAPYLLSLLIDALVAGGDWDAADALRADAHAYLPDGEALMAQFVGASLARLHACRGRTREARRLARAAVAAGYSSRVVPLLHQGTAVLGFVELSAGHHASADGHLWPLVSTMVEIGLGEPTFARFVPDEIESLVRLNRLDQAESVLEPWQLRAEQLGRPYALATAGRCRALLLAAQGDRSGAIAAGEAALTQHRALPEPFELARTQLAYGTVLRRARRPGAARAMVRLARDEFDRLGARQWSIAALAELTRLGVGPATGEQLSGPERRVVDEVVRGATNREVAGTLFISESTVEATLWRVYAKLGVRSRTELARLMAASSA